MLIGLHDSEKEHFKKAKTFPNYALMKISAYHKEKGDTVEYEVGRLKIGQELPLTSKAYPDTVFHGKVVNVSKNPDFAIKKSTNELNDQDVVTYEVKIKLSDEDDVMLYPGMLVSVNLDEAGTADAANTDGSGETGDAE